MKLSGHRKKSLPMTIDLHVMITFGDGIYSAVCLEMGLATAGPDLDTVKSDMGLLIRDHIRGCLEEGRPRDMFVPAAPEYWLEYTSAVASQSCRQRTKLPLPALDAGSAGDETLDYVSHVQADSFVCA